MVRKIMRYPGGLAKAVTISYDDGVQQDMQLLELMKKYGIKGTFNLNSARFITRDHVYPEGKIWRAMVDEDVLPTYDPEFCSIATHSAHHPTLLDASEAEIADEILSDRMALEKLFGRIIRGHAIPNGPYDEKTIRVGKLCGLSYMRAVKSSHSYLYPDCVLPLNPTCSHNDPLLFELTEEFLTKNVWEKPFLLYVWGHSYSFEEDNNWHVIEDFFKKVSGKSDVWYATNDEIFDYAEKFKRLESTVSGHTIFNPTDTELWFVTSANGQARSIKPGETLKI